MKYYRVKPEFVGKRLCVCKRGYYVNMGYELIANELFTEKEYAKLQKNHVFGCSPLNCVELVEIPKNKIYWFFGARFENKEG